MIDPKKKVMISCYLDKSNYKIFKKMCSIQEEVLSRVVGRLIFEYIQKNGSILEERNKQLKEKKNV